jgi:hypothetical protein
VTPTKRRQRGYIEQLPSGAWRAEAYAGVDPLTGKRRRIRTTAKSKRAAEIELTKLLAQVDEGRQPRSNVTVRQVVEMWLDVVELEDTTRQRYEGLVRRYVEPTFGSMAAAKVDAELLERFYGRLRRCNQLCTGESRKHVCRPLSGSTVRAIHFILRASLDRAVRWRYLAVNQAALAEPPPFERPEPDPPSTNEVAALLNDAWRDPMWGMLLWLTMVSGCRRGEVCALRWTTSISRAG